GFKLRRASYQASQNPLVFQYHVINIQGSQKLERVRERIVTSLQFDSSQFENLSSRIGEQSTGQAEVHICEDRDLFSFPS
ncbi:hypothetical protein LINPERHAP1_LOCUS37449, partial [Linum perenne]